MPTKTQNRTALLTSQSLAAGSTARAVIDCTGVDMGFITYRITNGGTGPTTQCVARILAAHRQSPAPSAGAESTADLGWKQVNEIGGGVAANGGARGFYRFGPEAAFLEIEFAGHTGQAVTIEAHVTTTNYP